MTRLIAVHPYGSGTQYSGPTVFLDRLFSEVSAAMDITVLYGKRSVEDEGFVWAKRNVPLLRFRDYQWYEQLAWALRVCLWIAFRARSADVLHIHGAALFNLTAAFAARIRGIDYVILPLAAGGEVSPRSMSSRLPLIRSLKRYALSHASIVFALSAGVRAELVDFGVSGHRISDLRNPVDLSAIGAPRVSAPSLTGTLTIGYVGKVYSVKRPEYVLDAAAELVHAHNVDIKCLFIGPYGGSEEARSFEDRISRLGLTGRVEVTGYRRDVPDLLPRLDVFVLPSQKEGLPGSLVEALSAGVPAVVTDVGAMGDLVRRAGGGQIVEGDPQSIAAAIIHIAGDAARYRAMSATASAYVRSHYGAAAVADDYYRALTTRKLGEVAK